MKKILTIVFLVSLLISCSSTKIGTRKLVQTSGDKPDWARDSKVFDQTGNKMFFEATLLGRKYLDVARVEADQILRSEIAKKLATVNKERFRKVWSGNNRDLGNLNELLQEAVDVSTKNIQVTGFNITDIYWEKYEVQREYGVDYLFDVYVRGSIPNSNFNILYKKSIQNLISSDNEKLKKLGEELLGDSKF